MHCSLNMYLLTCFPDLHNVQSLQRLKTRDLQPTVVKERDELFSASCLLSPSTGKDALASDIQQELEETIDTGDISDICISRRRTVMNGESMVIIVTQMTTCATL